jgi:hypothetical protein
MKSGKLFMIIPGYRYIDSVMNPTDLPFAFSTIDGSERRTLEMDARWSTGWPVVASAGSSHLFEKEH